MYSLSEIINLFDGDNIKKNGLNSIIEVCKNIVIDKINNNIITNKEMNSIMNINDERSNYLIIVYVMNVQVLMVKEKMHIEYIIHYMN